MLIKVFAIRFSGLLVYESQKLNIILYVTTRYLFIVAVVSKERRCPTRHKMTCPWSNG